MHEIIAPSLPPPATKVWTDQLERARFLKVPKILFYLGRYEPLMGEDLQPRHILLLLALASRKFREEPIRAYWSDLASALGTRRDTVRRWAYELRDMKLLRILREGGEDSPRGRSYKDERNTFDIAPFVALLDSADERARQRQSEVNGER